MIEVFNGSEPFQPEIPENKEGNTEHHSPSSTSYALTAEQRDALHDHLIKQYQEHNNNHVRGGMAGDPLISLILRLEEEFRSDFSDSDILVMVQMVFDLNPMLEFDKIIDTLLEFLNNKARGSKLNVIE